MRFPGGCIVNMNGGSATTTATTPNARARVYRWKETIGPVEERPTNRNMWGYNQSYGLGYMEYFQYSEDIGASPLPVVPVGTNSCGGTTRLTTDAQLEPWIQDTLDLIQFANGSDRHRVGRQARRAGSPRAVQPQVPRARQRGVRPAVEHQLPEVRAARSAPSIPTSS